MIAERQQCPNASWHIQVQGRGQILALSDRILVLYEGRVAGEFARGTVTERELGIKMGGA